jgi:hypothetical protein
MAEDRLKYDKMVEGALRGVVREALNEAATNGLPGDHHFYITFHTDAPDVIMPDWLRAQYADQMTIILQNQFWGLEVAPESFAVTLSFNNRQERLCIPFDAISGFADPAVQFGLQFEATEADLGAAGGEAKAPESNAAADDDGGADVVTLDKFRKK